MAASPLQSHSSSAIPSILSPSAIAARLTGHAMSEGEILTRAREAHIATARPLWPWSRRQVRRGRHDKKLTAIITALRDVDRPIAVIVAERDHATAAIVLRSIPGLGELDKTTMLAVAAGLALAVRIGRKG